jgi:hypothetical protein
MHACMQTPTEVSLATTIGIKDVTSTAMTESNIKICSSSLTIMGCSSKHTEYCSDCGTNYFVSMSQMWKKSSFIDACMLRNLSHALFKLRGRLQCLQDLCNTLPILHPFLHEFYVCPPVVCNNSHC